MHRAYLGFGSNLGDRAGNIARALKALKTLGVRVIKLSSLYETAPVNARGGWFLNAAAEVETGLSAEELMATLLEIEKSLGRTREGTRAGKLPSAEIKAERAIDIDILLFDSARIAEPGLDIPHPRMAERRFVLAPLAEIAPGAVHPVLKKTVAVLLDETPNRSAVKRYDR